MRYAPNLVFACHPFQATTYPAASPCAPVLLLAESERRISSSSILTLCSTQGFSKPDYSTSWRAIKTQLSYFNHLHLIWAGKKEVGMTPTLLPFPLRPLASTAVPSATSATASQWCSQWSCSPVQSSKCCSGSVITTGSYIIPGYF